MAVNRRRPVDDANVKAGVVNAHHAQKKNTTNGYRTGVSQVVVVSPVDGLGRPVTFIIHKLRAVPPQAFLKPLTEIITL